jgi:predicted RNA-binding Zn ribbon-like protein
MNGRSLNFVGTMKHRNSAREELLTEPKLLSDWAVQGGLVDAAIDVTDDDLVAAIELREAIYRTVTARLDGRRLQPADVDLLNERASGAQLTPRLLRTGATRRDGTPSQLLATLAADLLDLLAGFDVGWAPAAIRRKSRPSAPASAPRRVSPPPGAHSHPDYQHLSPVS